MNSITSVKSEKNLLCVICNKKLFTSNALKDHSNSTGHNLHKCPECDRNFTSINALNQHKKSAHQKKLICEDCKKKFETHESLTQHKIATHKTKYSCPKCKLGFETEKKLNEHIKKEGIFQCSNCNKNFSSQIGLTQHNKMAKCTKKKILCPHCNEKFKNENAMKQHVKSGTCQNKKFVCSHCSKSLTSQNLLNQHINSSHLSKIIKCDQCNKKFKTLSALEQHKYTKHVKLIYQIGTDISKKADSTPKDKARKTKLALFERLNIREKISRLFRKILHRKKIIVMDECLHNNKSVINTLKDGYEVIPLPNELKTHSDGNLRLALIEKKYGLATKDQEMALIAGKMKIKPVYLLIDRKGNRALIRVRKNIK